MPQTTFNVGDLVRCKCHSACDATLMIVGKQEEHPGVDSDVEVYLVEHYDHHFKERHFVTRDIIEPLGPG